MMQLILLGPPGSGKGTMATDLVRLYQIPHISTGDIFRQNIREKTPLGQEAEAYIKSGALVPDAVTISMVKDRLAQTDCAGGFILDGFPRTIPQAEALAAMLAEKAQPVTAVLNIVVSDQVVMDRLSERRVCPQCGRVYNLISLPPKAEGQCDDCGGQLIQRDDDRAETVRQRLNTYHAQTQPLISYYRDLGLLIDVLNEGAVGSSLNFVRNALAARLTGSAR